MGTDEKGFPPSCEASRRRSSIGNTCVPALLLLLFVSPALGQAEDFVYTTNNSEITIVRYTSWQGGAVTIPGTINGLPVTSIGEGAFGGRTNVTSVTIPSSVKSVGRGAFTWCSYLASVALGDGVTSIGDQTFAFCTSLTSVTIPSGVTNIGSAAFVYCFSLTNVTIPSGVTNLSDQLFQNCVNLAGVYFHGNAPSLDGSFVFTDANNAKVYYLPGTTGWGATFAGRPTALWQPEMQTGDGNFGVRTNQFGFNIAWAEGMTVVVDACTNLSNPTWSPLQTNTLTSDTLYFCDPQWTNYPARFYRVRWP